VLDCWPELTVHPRASLVADVLDDVLFLHVGCGSIFSAPSPIAARAMGGLRRWPHRRGGAGAYELRPAMRSRRLLSGVFAAWGNR